MFDDSIVSEATDDDIINNYGYVLFYKMRDSENAQEDISEGRRVINQFPMQHEV